MGKVALDRAHRQIRNMRRAMSDITLGVTPTARATLAKQPFVVNPTFVKFDRNLLNKGKICPNCGKIHTHTNIYLLYLMKFCRSVSKFKLNIVNFDQI